MKTDLELKKDVEDELNWEPTVNAAHIGVAANNGVVTLTGHIPSYAERWEAEGATKRVFGVAAVANELEVKLPGSSERSDEDIAAACVAALKANYVVPDEKIKVVVRGKRVTLEGMVDWQHQRKAAMRAVRDILGVLSVTNDITVKPHASPNDVKQKIEQALRRSAEIDARRISVETHDGKVTLRGTVRAWTEKEEAEHAAWAAPGVTTVENQINITY